MWLTKIWAGKKSNAKTLSHGGPVVNPGPYEETASRGMCGETGKRPGGVKAGLAMIGRWCELARGEAGLKPTATKLQDRARVAASHFVFQKRSCFRCLLGLDGL